MNVDDLNDTEYRLLAEIAENPGKDLGQLAGSIGIEKSHVSQRLKKLRENGLVVKSHGNGRVQHLGREILEQEHSPEPNGSLQWLITGKAKELLAEKWLKLRDEARRYEDAYLYAHQYRPPKNNQSRDNEDDEE